MVRVNNASTKPLGVNRGSGVRPWPSGTVYAFDIPPEAMTAGETVIEITAGSAPVLVQWVEVAYL